MLPHSRAHCRSRHLKSTQTLCQSVSFANLKSSAWGSGICWDTLQEWRCWWVPFLHCLSTSLKLARAFIIVFIFLHQIPSSCSPSTMLRSAAISQQRVLHMPGTPIFTSGGSDFVTGDCRMPLDYHLALESKKACVLRSYSTVIMGGTVLGWLPPSEHRTDSQLKYAPHLSEKEAYLLVKALWPEKQASCSSSLVSPWKEFISLTDIQIF